MESENEVQNRADDFTEDEMDILIQEVTQRREIINAKFGGNITKLRKQRVWEVIAAVVSAMPGIKRTWKDVQHKLSAMKSVAKKKNGALKRELFKTGGGPAPKPLTQRDVNILDFIHGRDSGQRNRWRDRDPTLSVSGQFQRNGHDIQ